MISIGLSSFCYISLDVSWSEFYFLFIYLFLFNIYIYIFCILVFGSFGILWSLMVSVMAVDDEIHLVKNCSVDQRRRVPSRAESVGLLANWAR